MNILLIILQHTIIFKSFALFWF